MQSPWRTLLEHIELMPKDQDFRFQPASRLEAVAQRTDEEESNCDHQPQACSDSLAAVTPADGVFGSDSRQEASCGPTFLVGLLGEPGPHQFDGGQAQIGKEE